MKKIFFTTLTAAALIGSFHSIGRAQVVINEVYPGGGSSTGTPAYMRDFVELYNSGLAAVSLTGYAVQYASATGNFTGTIVLFGAGSTIAAGDYLSIYTGATGTAGATLTAGQGVGFVTYVAPSNSASLAATAGAVRLFNTSTSTVVDLVGYGTTLATGSAGDAKFEGAAAAAPTSTAMSIDRTGFVDTNNNANDFSSMTPTPNGGTAATMVVPAPEPSTLACIFGGLATLVFVQRRRTAL